MEHSEQLSSNLPEKTKQTVWWGRSRISVATQMCWQVGPMTLLVQRLAREWRVGYASVLDDTKNQDDCWLASPAAIDELDPRFAVTRFSVSDQSETFWLMPVLADRAVVTRPESNFYIPPNDEVVLFVTTPVWVRLEVGETPKALQEYPLQRPSDTWFGPPTLEGELCYASRTRCLTELAAVPFRPHRAITPVLVKNGAHDPLLLERLNLPVPYLSLYATLNDGRLWTQPVTLTREKGGDLASLKFENAPPNEAKSAVRVAGARKLAERNILIKAFGALFS